MIVDFHEVKFGILTSWKSIIITHSTVEAPSFIERVRHLPAKTKPISVFHGMCPFTEKHTHTHRATLPRTQIHFHYRSQPQNRRAAPIWINHTSEMISTKKAQARLAAQPTDRANKPSQMFKRVSDERWASGREEQEQKKKKFVIYQIIAFDRCRCECCSRQSCNTRARPTPK